MTAVASYTWTAATRRGVEPWGTTETAWCKQKKALCGPCESHTLNLVVVDATKSFVKSLSFFGLLQRLFNLFSSSVQRWEIMQKYVNLTVNNLPTSRCCVDSVNALRYQNAWSFWVTVTGVVYSSMPSGKSLNIFHSPLATQSCSLVPASSNHFFIDRITGASCFNFCLCKQESGG